jgi:hypothetical protein
MTMRETVLTTRSASELRARRGVDGEKPSSLFPTRHLLLSSLIKERGGGTPANAGYHRRILRMRRAPFLERARLTAFHHGSRLRELFHPKGSAQARLPGTRSERALPAFACPSPGSTSRPGHRAGGLIPKPPGSGLQIRPRAPHLLHLSACLRKASLVSRMV